jgi:hypothetical protein
MEIGVCWAAPEASAARLDDVLWGALPGVSLDPSSR